MSDKRLTLKEGESLNDGEHCERIVSHRTKAGALRRLRAAKAKLGENAGKNWDRAIRIIESCEDGTHFDITVDDSMHTLDIEISISTSE